MSSTSYHCWQDMERVEKINKVLNDGLLADCQFLVGPEDSTAEKIMGHKIMFVLESPVFEKMLAGSFVEKESKHEIRINDVLPDDFKNFRHLLYYNDYSVYKKLTLVEIFEIYRIADKYLASSINKKCLEYLTSIKKGLSMDNLIILFEFASNLEDKTLLYAIEKDIAACNVDTILNDKIKELPETLFYDFIRFVSNLQNPPKPLAVFNAIKEYFERHFCNDGKGDNKVIDSERRDTKQFSIYKANLLQLVRFEKISSKDFIDGPAKSDLLDIQLKNCWLEYYCLAATGNVSNARKISEKLPSGKF